MACYVTIDYLTNLTQLRNAYDPRKSKPDNGFNGANEISQVRQGLEQEHIKGLSSAGATVTE